MICIFWNEHPSIHLSIRPTKRLSIHAQLEGMYDGTDAKNTNCPKWGLCRDVGCVCLLAQNPPPQRHQCCACYSSSRTSSDGLLLDRAVCMAGIEKMLKDHDDLDEGTIICAAAILVMWSECNFGQNPNHEIPMKIFRNHLYPHQATSLPSRSPHPLSRGWSHEYRADNLLSMRNVTFFVSDLDVCCGLWLRSASSSSGSGPLHWYVRFVCLSGRVCMYRASKFCGN